MKYPAATACPGCGVVEATAICRWCGCWKFGVMAVNAAFARILAGTWRR